MLGGTRQREHKNDTYQIAWCRLQAWQVEFLKGHLLDTRLLPHGMYFSSFWLVTCECGHFNALPFFDWILFTTELELDAIHRLIASLAAVSIVTAFSVTIVRISWLSLNSFVLNAANSPIMQHFIERCDIVTIFRQAA